MPLLPRNPGKASGGKPGIKPGAASAPPSPPPAAPPRTPPPAAVVKPSTAARAQGSAGPGMPAGPPVPTDPVERVRLLLTLTARLGPLLEREISAVRTRRWRDLSAVQDEKRSVSRRYEDVARLIRLDRTALAELPADLLQRLSDETARLDALAQDSASTLERGTEAQRRVLDVTIRATNQNRTAASAYVRARSPGPHHGGPSTSATLNQKL